MKEISGDQVFSNKVSALWYLLYNFIRGIAGHTHRLPARYWHTTSLESGKKTPIRKYLNQFLLQETPKIIPIQTIDEVLEVGCGSGYFRDILTQLGYRRNYVGIDVYKHENFNTSGNYPFSSTFIESKIENFHTDTKFDLIISNTVLEHVADDVAAIKQCNHLVKSTGVQIHIIPSFWLLFIYLWHGYRQYNPKRIRRLFQGTPYTVYRLGGIFSLLLHFFFITFPLFVLKTDRFRDLAVYPRLIAICNRLDRFLPICSYMNIVVIKGMKL